MFKALYSFDSTEVRLEILDICHGVFLVFAVLRTYQTANVVGIRNMRTYW